MAAVVVAACLGLAACGGSSQPLTRGGKSGSASAGGAGDGSGAGSSASPSGGGTASASGQGGQVYIDFAPETSSSGADLERTATLMRKRAKALRLGGVEITVRGREISVSGPASSQETLRSLGWTAELGFRPVLSAQPVDKGQCRAADASASASEPLTACGKTGGTYVSYSLKPVAVPGTDVSAAEATYDKQSGAGWLVQIKFTAAGSKRFAQVTGELAPQQPPANQFAIVVDGTVLSAPSVNQALTGGEAQISGSFTQREAEELAAQLNSGALPVRLNEQSVSRMRS
ncbi:hypothetical protein AB5J56_25000 [Streptomyces sp. R21]|uniref:SecDF P1 head subdomain domain-containing protein n=1 Tax=Streptomyces sp. R21 TaxID=3238627 RepID=A0AB39PD26_9ACTN